MVEDNTGRDGYIKIQITNTGSTPSTPIDANKPLKDLTPEELIRLKYNLEQELHKSFGSRD